MESPIKKEFIEVGDTKVACCIRGSGKPVVLIHGIPTSSYLWHKVIAELQGDYKCIAPDLMGLGDTEAPLSADFSLPAQAKMIIGLMDALKLKSPHLVAHDQGGGVAQIIAARYPDKIQTLAMMDVVTRNNWPVPAVSVMMFAAKFKTFFDFALKRVAKLSKLSAKMPWAMPKAFYDHSNYSEELIEELYRPISSTKERRDRFAKFVLAGDPQDTIEIWDDLGEFKKPTLILWASHDKFLNIRWGRLLADHIKGAGSLRIINQAGHYLQLEKPAEIARELKEFWQKSQ